jgi:hypothetical protein
MLNEDIKAEMDYLDTRFGVAIANFDDATADKDPMKAVRALMQMMEVIAGTTQLLEDMK